MNKVELVAFLEAHQIPLCEWGKGEAKTLDHLFAEIDSGEAVIEKEGVGLVRIVSGSVVDVCYQLDNVVLRLKESKQVFSDGRERSRSLDASIGEKIRPGERALDAAHRALREELGILDDLVLTSLPLVAKGPIPSVSFPGLMTKYVSYRWQVFLPARLYKPEGYVERQPDKTSYFVWVSI